MANLQHVPGLAGYLASQQNTAQQEAGQLQQFGQVMNLRQAIAQQEAMKQAQAQDAHVRSVLQQTGGDPEKAAGILIQSGNIAGAAKLAPLIEQQRKSKEGQQVGSGGLLRPDGTIVPPAARPQQFAPPEIVRLQEHLGSLPAGDPRRAPIEQRIKMLGERSPGVQVNMPPTSDTVQGPDGRFYKFRIGKDGKTEVVPLQTATGDPLRPPESAAERKDRVSQTDEQVTVDSVRQRVMSMTQKLQGNSGIVGPAGIVRRMGETAAGVVSPDVPTPAIDYQNDMRLLVADVRKLVEKDPNLSNSERQNMYEMLGGGTLQTPGSAIRTLTNVLGFVENKKMTGPGRAAQLEGAVKAAGWDYEPSKYDYRVVNGKVQRKAK